MANSSKYYMETFAKFCNLNEETMRELNERFHVKICSFGRHLDERIARWSYCVPRDQEYSRHHEFLDFIDGHNFIIEKKSNILYHVIPLYKKE